MWRKGGGRGGLDGSAVSGRCKVWSVLLSRWEEIKKKKSVGSQDGCIFLFSMTDDSFALFYCIFSDLSNTVLTYH